MTLSQTDLLTLVGVLALIVLDTLAGMLLALWRRQWQWGRVADFLASEVLPYLGGLAVLALLAQLRPDVRPVFLAAAAATAAREVSSILAKVRALGVPLDPPQGG